MNISRKKGATIKETKTMSSKKFLALSPKQILALVLGVLAVIAAIILPFHLFVTVAADEIVVKQGVFDGKLTVYTQPGLY